MWFRAQVIAPGNSFAAVDVKEDQDLTTVRRKLLSFNIWVYLSTIHFIFFRSPLSTRYWRWFRFFLKKTVDRAKQCDHWIWLRPLRAFVIADAHTQSWQQDSLFPTSGTGSWDLPQRSPFWAGGGSCQDLSVSSPVLLQMYCKAALWGMVWESCMGALCPSSFPFHWHCCDWRLPFQPTSHWSGRWHFSHFSYIREANSKYVSQGPKEKQHLILKENMWLLPYVSSKNEWAAKKNKGPHTAEQWERTCPS